MRVLAVLLAACTAACAAARPPDLPVATAGRDIAVAVVSWNVHAGRGDLPRFVDDLVAGKLTGAPVNDFVILLQETIEGGKHDVMAFAAERQLFAAFEPVWEYESGASGNAILSTRPLSDVRVINLPKIRRVRKALFARVQLDDLPLFAVCAHLENRVSWFRGVLFFSEGARLRQTDALLDVLPDGPGVVGGDFNTWLGRGEPAWRALSQRFDDTPEAPLEPTFKERLVLDHLFFDLPEGWEAARDVVADRYGSDHNPVLGVILRTRGSRPLARSGTIDSANSAASGTHR